jgi:hypothetical protein
MDKFMAKVKVVLTALPTYMTALAVIVTIVARQLADVLPDKAAGIVQWSATIVAFLTAAVTVIRNVTPVLPIQRGVLPQGPPAPGAVPIKMDPPVDIPGGQHDNGGI